MKIQKRTLLTGLLLVFLLSVMFFDSCGNNKNNTESTDSTKVETIKPFSVENYNFVIKENDKFINYDKAIYQRGDEVYMVLENVGPFKKGSDSLNNAQMKLEVFDAVGTRITLDDSLFRESRGKSNFPGNMLKKPYARFATDQTNKPGKYTMTVTIYDLLSKDSIVISDDFLIE
ncbi:MAG: hypothetical protein U0W24_14675 [Bacteroidales bacterium]